MRVLAIIPAYNEEASLAATVEGLLAARTGCDYLVVNDGSTDGTEEVCRERGYRHVTHPVNLGLTAGFQTGVTWALRHGYDAVVQFDADGQHVAEHIRPMVEAMERTGADIVIGSRFVGEHRPLSARMMGSRLISALVRLTCGVSLRDPTSGMRLYNRAMMEQFARRFDFGPEPDSVAYLMRRGARVTEVPVQMRERQAGESYLSLSRSVSYMARVCTSILLVQWFR